jgi:alkanesulfonate monooxygenase SsuD/methylene tetrahydromethanopterin reductase-like flavin-dependent oxidoreductase (luciferase family)
VQEAERLGAAVCFVPEAWGSDAATPLAYLAAKTERMLLGSGIMQISARTPAMTAQTALTLATLSANRFILGLGVSGPQVVEGLHGQPFAHPLDQPANPHIPIYLATLAPKMLTLTGELADGWLGTSFIPEAAAAYLEHLAAGAARAGRSLAELDLSQGGDVAFSDAVETLVAARKPRLAFSLGGMGSATTNFYNDAYSRQGWAEVAAEVRRLWVAGRRQEAAAIIPDDMVLQTTMIGTASMVRERMRAWQNAGITTLRVYPAGATLDERLSTLARAIEIVNELNRQHQIPPPPFRKGGQWGEFPSRTVS